jgi:hypothetical protein
MPNFASIPPSEAEDIAQLRAAFPGWDIEARWTVAGTGPDSRVLVASRGDVTVSALDAQGLAGAIRKEEAQ